MRTTLLTLYLLSWLTPLAWPVEDTIPLRSCLLLGLVFLLFLGAGLFMSWSFAKSGDEQSRFTRRFFLAFGYAGFALGLFQLAMGEYPSAMGALSVCCALLVGMLTPLGRRKT